MRTSAPPLAPSQCAETPPVGHVDVVMGQASNEQHQQRSNHFGRRFGDAKNFVQQSIPPPRPTSAATAAPMSEPIMTLEELNQSCTPAVDVSLSRPRSSSGRVQNGRPFSATSMLSERENAPLESRRYSRPSSALSVTTRDINLTVGSVLREIADREPSVASSKLRGADTSRIVRRKNGALRNASSSPAASGIFSLTHTSLDEASMDDRDPVEEVQLEEDAEVEEKKVLPFFLTREGTWKRLWRTKADQERERFNAAEEQLRQTSGGSLTSSHAELKRTKSYAAGLVDEEHEEALLSRLRTNEKISLLRHDPEKRRLFSSACQALSSAIKKEGETVILKRRARSAALLRQASSVRPAPSAVGLGKLQVTTPAEPVKRPSHFLALPLNSNVAHSSANYESSEGSDSDACGDNAEERNYFAAASKMTHDIQKQRRSKAALERHELFRCARLIRAAEDIEKVDVMRSKQFTDVQVEVHVNFFATTTVLAAHLGSWLAALSKRLQHQAVDARQQQSQAAAVDKPAANAAAGGSHQRLQRLLRGCSGLVQLRKDAILKVSARTIWNVWRLCRARMRSRRKRLSIALVRRFLTHRRDTMRFVVAVNRYMDTVRYVQSLWRGTMMLRTLRHDLALRQMQLFLVRIIKEDAATVAQLKSECRQKECDIANRKGIPRLVKSQWIVELKKETEALISASQQRARQAEALRDRQEVVKGLVERALAKKHDDYHQQVGRYAKALASYNREVNALREKRVIVVNRRCRSGTSVAPLTARASVGKAVVASVSSTPPPTHRSLGESARRASSMESGRRHVHIEAQIDAFMRGGKIFVEEPSTIRSSTSVARSGSMSARSSSIRGGAPSGQHHRGDAMVWALLKERGVVGHIPIKPIQPFFHSLFHRGEMMQLIEDSPP